MKDQDEPQMSTEDIVAAFRSRKAAAAVPPELSAAPPEPPLPPFSQVPAPSPPPSPSPPPLPSPPASSSPLPPLPPRAAMPPEGTGMAPAVRTGPSIVAAWPAVQDAGALTAAAPALNLSDRLLADRFVAARGSRRGVAAGIATALLGFVALALGGTEPWHGAGLPRWWDAAALALAALGIAMALLSLVVPRSRSLRVRLAATQREEWARVQGEADRLRGLALAGGGLAGAGLLVAAAASRLLGDGAAALYVTGGGIAMAVFGLAVLAWASARRSLVQRLYVQTLVLSRLEQTGLGPAAQPDPRVAPVLRALDQLLGALPESAVRRFLASDEAAQYLELIDELAGERHGRP